MIKKLKWSVKDNQRIMDRKNEQPKKPSIEVPLYYMPDHDDQGNEISDTWFVDVSGISHIHNGL